MKHLFITAAIVTILFACNEKSKTEQNASTLNASTATPTAGALSTSTTTTNTNVTTVASTVTDALPGAKKSSINIDKYPAITIDGSRVSSISYKDDIGADIDEMYYIQNENGTITITEIQVSRGEATGLNKSIYTLNIKDLYKDVAVEEVKNKNYTNGKYYIVNVECSGGNNCVTKSYEDVGIGKPTTRKEMLAQVAFSDKAEADSFLAKLKKSL